MVYRIWLSGLLCLAAATATGASAASPLVFYVSPKGNDAWTGTQPEPGPGETDGPFQTLVRARDALREAAPKGAIVYVRGGVYHLSEPLRLGPEDSGTVHFPVVWQPFPGESPRLIGGIEVDGFEALEGEVMRANLAGTPLSGKKIDALYCNQERQDLARWPNAGEGELPGGGFTFVAGRVEEAPKRQFRYLGSRPAGWKNTEELRVSIWPNYNWWQDIVGVESLDNESGTVTLASELPYTIEPGRRLFFENLREELDTAGEWHFNTATNHLDFWPPVPLDEAAVIAPVLEHLIVLDGASYVHIAGFDLEATTAEAIRVVDSKGCLVAGNSVRNTGGFGVTVRGGESVRVHGNDITDTARGGIVLSGGVRETLRPGHHEATNNHIHHFATRYKTYQTGINVSGVGNRLAHNLIHDAPHIGILLGGNEHIIEYNDIHDVCLEGADNGAFYMGRDWTQRGNILRHNRFADVYGFGLANLGPDSEGNYRYESPHQAWGVYLDDCTSGTTVAGNLFVRVPLCGVMVGGGRDNVVENNIFVECIPAFHIDDRWDAFQWETMFERLEKMNYKEPPYSERYPELLTMGDDPRKPENNRFVRNVVYYSHDDFRGLTRTKPGSGEAVVYDFDQFDPESTVVDQNIIWHDGKEVRVAWSVYKEPGSEILDWAAWREKGFDANSILFSPLFADPAREDFALLPRSKAFELGIEQIPTRRIGLYQDEFRASWPPPAKESRTLKEHREYVVSLTAATEASPPVSPEQ